MARFGARPARCARSAARVLVLVGVTLAARAPAVELEFAAPAGAAPCATEEIAYRVERSLGQRLADLSGPNFLVSIERSDLGFEGRVDVARAADAAALAQRRFSAPGCDELIDTLALTIVLAIGAHGRPGGASARPPPAGASEAEAPALGLSAAAVNQAEIEPSALDAGAAPDVVQHWAAFGSMLGDTGSLPALGYGVTLGLELAWPVIELRALGMWLPRRRGVIDEAEPASPGAEIGLLAGGLLACAPLATPAGPVLVTACAGWELGRLEGHGIGVDSSHSTARWWSAPRADLALRWALPLRSLALELALTAAAPLTRDEFVLQGIGSVHRPANVVGRAGLGLRWELDQ